MIDQRLNLGIDLETVTFIFESLREGENLRTREMINSLEINELDLSDEDHVKFKDFYENSDWGKTKELILYYTKLCSYEDKKCD